MFFSNRVMPLVFAACLVSGAGACRGDDPRVSERGGDVDGVQPDAQLEEDAVADAGFDSTSPSGDVEIEDVGADLSPADVATVDVETDVISCPPFMCDDFINVCEGASCPTMSDYRVVVPSEGLPDEAGLQLANNNLDVVGHEGRIFLAFRTGPYHFADADAMIHVVSSTDERDWRWEASYHLNTDLREPRFLSWEGRLFLYFALLGTNPIDFEPQGMMVSEYNGAGDWSEPELFHEPGFIPWRAKVINGVPYLITYFGGEAIYDLNENPIKVHWLTTINGRDWTPVVPEQPVVLTGGSSETDFVLLDDGALVSVSRNEAGDELGWGSRICRAEAESLGQWDCVGDPRKFDSPLMFRHESRVFLIGRRNVSETGEYDLGGEDLSPTERTRRNLINYSSLPKRCALWEIDPDALTVTLLFDLPSRGDTCFAGIVPLSENRYAIYNYTSPLDQRDINWFEGQGGHTLIYRLLLSFP